MNVFPLLSRSAREHPLTTKRACPLLPQGRVATVIMLPRGLEEAQLFFSTSCRALLRERSGGLGP